MHMKDNHMRNAQLKPGYNVQIGVDSEYIVAADSGYESEESYTYLREQKQKPYIKPQTYDKWKNAVSSRISANVKTWDMMKKLTHTLVMPGKHCSLFLSKSRKVKVAMNRK